jgi:hypothetical protein
VKLLLLLQGTGQSEVVVGIKFVLAQAQVAALASHVTGK